MTWSGGPKDRAFAREICSAIEVAVERLESPVILPHSGTMSRRAELRSWLVGKGVDWHQVKSVAFGASRGVSGSERK